MMRIQQGFTLVGMMVGVSLGMIVTLAALAMFQVVRAGYASVVDGVLIEERGQRALAIMSHAIRQAGWIPVHVAQAAAHPAPAAPLEGRDDCANPSIGAELRCTRAGVLGSDALLVRVSGSGLANDPTLPDGTMSDCGGYALPARAVRSDNGPADHHAASNLFYIGIASDGVPQLLCRYPRREGNRVRTDAYTAGTLVRGVEVMQLRYGVDTDDDGRIDRFVPARSLQGQPHAGWHRVRAVQIAVVIRGERPTASPSSSQTLTLLPAQASDGQNDALSFVPTMHPELRRRVFATTIRLRNPSPCREAIC
nr:PilW family protein [uncultured Cupriavidus sp.]